MVPQGSTVFDSVSSFLVVLAMTLVVPHGVLSHLVWPFEVWLILDFLQDLMYWFSEHRINHLRSRRPRLPRKIPLGSVIVVAVRLEIPYLLKDNLTLPLALLLVLLNPLILVYPIHELAYIGSRFSSQRLPQAMLDRWVDLESPDGHIVKVTVYLVEHLSVYVRICF